MKKVVVTGGAGFIGSTLVDELIRTGYDVHIIDDLSTGKKDNVNSKAKLYKLDISSANTLRLESIIEGSEYVFHLAAKTAVQESLHNPESYELVNCLVYYVFLGQALVWVSKGLYLARLVLYTEILIKFQLQNQLKGNLYLHTL